MTALVDLEDELDGLEARVQQDHGAVAALFEFRLRCVALRRSDLAARAAYAQARGELNAGRPDAALDLIEVARTTWLSIDEPVQAARTELGRMAVLDHLGSHADALETGRRLLAQLEPLERCDDVVWMRGAANENIGVALGYLGRGHEALANFASAERLYRAAGRQSDVVRPCANRGLELVRLGRFHEAIEALDTAGRSFEEHQDHLFAARCWAWQGRALLALGDFGTARLRTDQAADLLADLPTSPEWARTQLVRAETLAAMNLVVEAAELYERLGARFADAELDHDRAEADLGRGRALARLGACDDAAAAFRCAGDGFVAVGDPAAAAAALVGLAQVDPSIHDTRLDEAIATLDESAKPLDRIEAQFIRAERALARGEGIDAVVDRADRLIRRHDLRPLQWRVAALRARAASARGDRAGALEHLQNALASLDELRGRVVAHGDRVHFLAGREQLHHELIELLIDEDPLEAHRVSVRARARTLVEEMAEERPDAEGPIGGELGATVTYQFLTSELVAFVEEPGHPVRVVRRLVEPAALDRLLDSLTAQWRRFRSPGLVARQHTHLLATVVDVLQQLHLALVAPLELDLDRHGAVLFVPQGRLADVPFHALHDGAEYLVERAEVAVAPTAAAARLAASRQRRPDRRLVLGVHAPEIPLVDRELDRIAAAASALVRRGAEATAEALQLHDLGHTDVVHVASHGTVCADNPLFSSLELADRPVTAAEIAGARLDGQIVVLSTCSSAAQRGRGAGEELQGLPRAFLAAGAGGIAANLWPSDDRAATDLMPRFHALLTSHHPAAALRRAQLDTMTRFPHPYHWAPTTWIGAPAPLETDR